MFAGVVTADLNVYVSPRLGVNVLNCRECRSCRGCRLVVLDYEVRLPAVAGTVTGMPGVIAVADPVRLGTAGAPLRFAEKDHPGGWRGNRYLMLDDREAFELTFWCGTCPFLFERQQGANRVLSPEGLAARLSGGLSDVDAEVVAAASGLLPDGEYLPVLTEMRPRLAFPGGAGDYFAGEQVRTWGISNFWGLPEYPRTPYYRGAVQPAGRAARLFEFIVPMVPPSWNDPGRVRHYQNQIAGGQAPACLAVAILDICQPAVAGPGATEPALAHWGLAHFLLDGHHKMQAAAQAAGPVRLLTLLAIDYSLASRDDILAVPAILAREIPPEQTDNGPGSSGTGRQ
jgi:hypothetical protein